MKKLWLLLFLVLFAAGCARTASLSKDMPASSQPDRYLFLHIISEPSGSDVDVDGHYAGKTPVFWMAPSEKYGRKPIAVVAHPVSQDQPLQKKVLHSFYETPQTVYFDMSKSR